MVIQNGIDVVQSRGEPKEYDYVVSHMLERNTRAYLLDLIGDNSRLLASGLGEEEVRHVIGKEFCGVIDPALRGSTMRTWLEYVKKRIDEHFKFSLR